MSKVVNLDFKIVNALGELTDIDAGQDVGNQMIDSIRIFVAYEMQPEVDALTNAQVQFLEDNIAILSDDEFDIVLKWLKNEYGRAPSGYYAESLKQLVRAFNI